MTQIDLSKLIFHSSFSGLGNYVTVPLSVTVPSSVVTTSPTIISGSTSMANAGTVSQTEVQLTGLDNTWYIFKGFLANFYTSGGSWTNNVANAAYEVDINTSYTTSSLVITISLFNLTLNSTVTTPAFVINCNASLYISPF